MTKGSLQKKEFICFFGSGGRVLMVGRYGSRGPDPKPGRHIFNLHGKQGESIRSGERLYTLNTHPQWGSSSSNLCPLLVPNPSQRHNHLGTRCSSTWAYGAGISHSDHHIGLYSVVQGSGDEILRLCRKNKAEQSKAPIGQRSRVALSEINPHSYSQLILDKCVENTLWEMTVS